jgi:hypothetical protein
LKLRPQRWHSNADMGGSIMGIAASECDPDEQFGHVA